MKIYTIGLDDAFSPVEIHFPNVRENLPDNVPLRHSEKNKTLPEMAFFIKPILNARAFSILHPLIENDVNVVRTTLEGKEWYVIEVTSEIDALDYEKSVIDTISSTYILPRKYCFKRERIENHSIFTLVNGRKAYTYVTDSFVKLVQQNLLMGLSFHLVWEDANPEE